MNSNQVFTGTIKRCTKLKQHESFDSETSIDNMSLGIDSFGYIQDDSIVEKENAILIQVRNGSYVDVESFKSAVDYFKVRQSLTKSEIRLGGLIMATHPFCANCLFVDETTLKPFYNKSDNKNISVRKLKKEISKTVMSQNKKNVS